MSMRKTLQLFALLVAAICMIGCSDDSGVDKLPNDPGNNPENPENPEDPENPENPTVPEITITEVELTYDSYTFEITSNVEGEFGYVYVKEGFDVPLFQDWFASNSGTIKDKTTVKIEGLYDDTTYKLCVVLRSATDGAYSAPKMITFTTPDDGKVNPIIIENTTYDTITFTINIPGSYVYQCISKDYLEYVGQTPESYISTVGIGITASGVQTIEWVDGNKMGDYNMEVKEDRDYYVIAAIAEKQQVVGDIFVATTRTPKRPTSNAGMTVELKNITSMGVTVTTTPSDSVNEYWVYVRDKVWAESIIGSYGESMLQSLVKNPTAGAWHLTAANEQVWEGLAPSTEYYCMVVIRDNMEAENLIIQEFTTTGATLAAPKVEFSMTRPSTDSYKTLSINIYSEDATSVRLAYGTKGDFDVMRKEGHDDDYILRNEGIDISGTNLEAIRTTGLSLKMEDLFPEVEYVALISVKNIEQTETIKGATMSTTAKPVPARVESDLFTSLLGEWEVSYQLQQFNVQNVSINSARVTIAQGADATTEKRYREQNRLVVLNWPFNVTAQGVHEAPVMQSPEKLMNYNPDYWGAYPELAYRDYGPKIFLEIGAGDVVTVPTSRSEYLYNWSDVDGIFYFFGCDLNNKFTAPATFPVTISADGNTLTIGAHQAGEEFSYGIYRPAVFRGSEPWAIALGDITLTRVN